MSAVSETESLMIGYGVAIVAAALILRGARLRERHDAPWPVLAAIRLQPESADDLKGTD